MLNKVSLNETKDRERSGVHLETQGPACSSPLGGCPAGPAIDDAQVPAHPLFPTLKAALRVQLSDGTNRGGPGQGNRQILEKPLAGRELSGSPWLREKEPRGG